MSKKYRVHSHELWIQEVEVEAESREDAKRKVLDGLGKDIQEKEFAVLMDNIEDWEVDEL